MEHRQREITERDRGIKTEQIQRLTGTVREVATGRGRERPTRMEEDRQQERQRSKGKQTEKKRKHAEKQRLGGRDRYPIRNRGR